MRKPNVCEYYFSERGKIGKQTHSMIVPMFLVTKTSARESTARQHRRMPRETLTGNSKALVHSESKGEELENKEELYHREVCCKS